MYIVSAYNKKTNDHNIHYGEEIDKVCKFVMKQVNIDNDTINTYINTYVFDSQYEEDNQFSISIALI